MNKELFEKGLAIRKSVLGAEYVEKSIAAADDFNRPMQELTTEYCWGWCWGREGLDKKTRSIINLAMISAFNRPNELKMHVKGAIRNGLTKEEIREVLLQVAIYCGIPAGVDSFRVAKEAFAELEKKSLDFEFAGAVAERIHVNAGLVEHAQQQVRDGGALGEFQVAAAFELAGGAARDQERQRGNGYARSDCSWNCRTGSSNDPAGCRRRRAWRAVVRGNTPSATRDRC